MSRSPASPRTNCDTRRSRACSISLGRAVVDDLRLVGLQPRKRIEHHHAVGHLLRRAHVVRHHDAGDRMLLPRAEDQFVDHVAHDRVEPGGRLVVEHDFRLQGQRPGQPHPLPHAAGKLGRLLANDVLRQAHLGQPRQDDRSNLLGALVACAAATERRRSGRSSCCRTAPPAGTGSRSGSAAGSVPSRSARPGSGRRNRPRRGVGRSSPMIVFSNTVLPQPLSPMTASVWPRGIVRSMSRSTCCRPKSTPTRSSWTSG